MNAISALEAIVGKKHVFAADNVEERYRSDFMGKFRSDPLCVVRPESTADISAILKVAADQGLAVVPMGGQTGTTNGTSADKAIKLSTERMNRIYEVDRQSMTITVDAGVTIQAAQDAAEAEGLLLPLDLGSRGSATVGGAIATNAGGSRVLRWGMMRDMLLGLEAVFADGTIVGALTKVIKDNAGYDWKQLMVGSEGTLGIVTKAVLRLRPMPTSAQTALIAVQGLAESIHVLRTLEADLAGRVSSFELLWGDFYDHVSGFQVQKRPRPMKEGYPLYCLVEALGSHPEADNDAFVASLSTLIDTGTILDAVIAQSERERQTLWLVRDDLIEAFNALGDWTAYDISMAHEDMPGFIKETRASIMQLYPDALPLFYGHVGDGNLHLVTAGPAEDKNAHHKLDIAVYDVVRKVSGSISGEHGIGLAKKEFLGWSRSEAEIALMKTLKRALDPKNILNPGKIVDIAA